MNTPPIVKAPRLISIHKSPNLLKKNRLFIQKHDKWIAVTDQELPDRDTIEILFSLSSKKSPMSTLDLNHKFEVLRLIVNKWLLCKWGYRKKALENLESDSFWTTQRLSHIGIELTNFFDVNEFSFINFDFKNEC